MNNNGESGKVIQFPKKIEAKKEAPMEPNFGMFAFAIVGGQVEIAGKLLGAILNLTASDAFNAASHYHDLYQKDNGIQSKAMHIRLLIQKGENTEALMSIHECFGLQGPPAIAALESMRAITDG